MDLFLLVDSHHSCLSKGHNFATLLPFWSFWIGCQTQLFLCSGVLNFVIGVELVLASSYANFGPVFSLRACS